MCPCIHHRTGWKESALVSLLSFTNQSRRCCSPNPFPSGKWLVNPSVSDIHGKQWKHISLRMKWRRFFTFEYLTCVCCIVCFFNFLLEWTKGAGEKRYWWWKPALEGWDVVVATLYQQGIPGKASRASPQILGQSSMSKSPVRFSGCPCLWFHIS